MNKDTYDNQEEGCFAPNDPDTAAAMIAQLQEEADGLRTQLLGALERVAELEAASKTVHTLPMGDAALRGLAQTYRTAVRNGHPDAVKHLDSLLKALGA